MMQGCPGGGDGAPFVVAGDLNADPTRYEISLQGRPPSDSSWSTPRCTSPVELLRSGGARARASAAGEPIDEMTTAAFLGGRRVDTSSGPATGGPVDGGV